MSWSVDGRHLATSGLLSIEKRILGAKILPTIAVWEVSGKKLVKAYTKNGPYTDVTLIGTQPLVLGYLPTTPDWNGSVAFSIWDAKSGALYRHVYGPTPIDDPHALQKNAPRSLSYSYAGNRIAAAHVGGKDIFLYNAVDGSREDIINTDVLAHSVSLSRDGSLLAFGQQSRQIIIQLPSKQQLASFYPFDTGSSGTAWSPDGKRVAFIKNYLSGIKASAHSDIKVYNAATGELLHDYIGDFSGAAVVGSRQTIAWSFDGRFIITSTSDGVIRLWRADRPELLMEVLREKGLGSAIALSPVANLLAIAGRSSVRIYEIK